MTNHQSPESAGLSPEPVYGATSQGILSLPLLGDLLDGRVQSLIWTVFRCRPSVSVVVGWGRRPSTRRSRALAAKLGLPFVALEDGFLRSHAPGDCCPPLSLVVDAVGIYYDSTRPSALEALLNSPAEMLGVLEGDAALARSLILAQHLSKYNHAPGLREGVLRADYAQRVLVVDQTAGDMSVALGGADAATFDAMLAAARAENSGATIYVKTHPEVSSGRKGGYLTSVQDDGRTVVLRDPINPLSLIEQMDRVYVVSSTMGFEALLAGKPVTCFGLPWYAGWGVTDDRQACARRTRRRSVDELFAAAYFHYTRYLNPVTHQRGTIFDVIDWLVRQKEMAARQRGVDGPARLICVGFRRWKAAHLKPRLALDPNQVYFVPTVQAARALEPRPGDRLVFWGGRAPAGLLELAQSSLARAVRVEDGFVRSVGLGSDLIPPLSLVLDDQGIYFDPSAPSALEQLLQTGGFTPEELERARAVRAFIVEHGITKYNLESRQPARWPHTDRAVVLVPGQVEDDASIQLGCRSVRTNLDLLRAARHARPEAFIVYKPHPDVSSGNRKGRLALEQARAYADHVETSLSVVSCIEACDEVHTMTSLTGFDALLRGKTVVTYGQPFYAGWGLTQDMECDAPAWGRRTRRLSLDELVAGALLRYPVYWDEELRGYTSCEAVLHRIVERRSRLEASGQLGRLHAGWLRRQGRKLQALYQAWTRRL
jgi:capsular polysaccharide export protein